MRTSVSVISDVGCARDNNEDNFVAMKFINICFQTHLKQSFIVKDPIQFYGIFDGMGGQSDGELAALKAAESFRAACYHLASNAHFEKEFYNIQHQLNRAVCSIAQQSKTRLGTTSTTLSINQDVGYISHLGDSRCYLWRSHHLNQLTKDHVQVRPSSGEGQKGKLTQYLGIFESELTIEPHQLILPLNDSDVFILCSDGVSDLVSVEDFEKILSTLTEPQAIAEEVIHRCLAKKAKDNCTVIVLRIDIPRSDQLAFALKRRLKHG